MGYTNFTLVYGRMGLPTIRFEAGGIKYLHSIYDPWQEARQLIDTWVTMPEPKEITVIGLGLGYHVFECLRRFPTLTEVTVIECYADLVELARQCFPVEMSDERIKIVSPRDCLEFGRLISAKDIQSIFLHPPSLGILPHEPVRPLLEEIQMLRASTEVQKSRLMMNWEKNQDRLSPETVLTGQRGIHRGTAGLLVAAGPSLDDARDFLLLQRQADAVIVAVSAALKKILSWGVIPNYVVHTDSTEKSAEYIRNVGDYPQFPELLVLPTVHPSVVHEYPGPVRWALQEGFDGSLNLATQSNFDTFKTGGSVSTLALSVLHYFGCDPITFVAQDLAYIDGRTHASGIHEELAHVSSAKGIRVPSVHGGVVETTITWNAFRRWIETFIENHPDRQYLNASAGAEIRGTLSIPMVDSSGVISKQRRSGRDTRRSHE